MDMVCERARLLITTAWVGSLWTIGYFVAPTLFITLSDRVLAGTLAGRLFYVEAWFSVVCAALLIAISLYQSKRVPWRVVGMLLCTLSGYFALQPWMENLRATGLTDPDIKWQFGILHSFASSIYLIQSALGAMLVLDSLKPTQHASAKTMSD